MTKVSKIRSCAKGFKIKNEKQIEKLRASGLNHVYCILNRSERLPLPLDNVDLAPFQNGKVAAATKEKQTAFPRLSARSFSASRKETIERNLERQAALRLLRETL